MFKLYSLKQGQTFVKQRQKTKHENTGKETNKQNDRQLDSHKTRKYTKIEKKIH